MTNPPPLPPFLPPFLLGPLQAWVFCAPLMLYALDFWQSGCVATLLHVDTAAGSSSAAALSFCLHMNFL